MIDEKDIHALQEKLSHSANMIFCAVTMPNELEDTPFEHRFDFGDEGFTYR